MKSLIAVFVSLLALGQAVLAKDVTKVLLVGHKLDHPFGTHMYLQECRLLAKCLNQNPGILATVSNGWPSDESLLKDIDALVFYSSPAADILLNEKNKIQAEALFKRGVGYTAIHWATGANLQNGPRYEQLLGGWFNFKFSGINVDKQRLVQIDPKHPICNGWTEYELHDEFYLRMKLSPKAKPLLKVTTKGIARDPTATPVVVEHETMLSACLNGNKNAGMLPVFAPLASSRLIRPWLRQRH